ncbi:MAG TPA: toll/interleukin-1 receptor domain-containing protein [Terracidiphilus sp.]|jgi:hypothetical protein
MLRFAPCSTGAKILAVHATIRLTPQLVRLFPGAQVAHIFVSHSSRDNEPASRMKDWLQDQGFTAVFLDFDKHAGIPPGADWERTLYHQIEVSEAVILIQTPNWMESKWCFAEFTQARALGKAIFPVIETPTGDTLIAQDVQALDLRSDRQGGLERLARQLTRIALDAQGGFDWDAARPPFPGLASFTEEEAAIYFGRDDDIRRLIERLNARRAQGGARLVALLGSSGSGKSSLLRAGVIPRLKRDRSNWIVLPPFRPHTQPLTEFACALAVACGPYTDSNKLRTALEDTTGGQVLRDLARDLRVRAGANEAQILIPIDQAEELFSTAEPAEAQRFFEFLSAALRGDSPFLALMALRSDFLGKLQAAEHLTAKFEEFSLGPLPLGRVADIIHGPARVAGLRVEEAFVQQVMQDAAGDDALPLLAFALRQLYERAQGDKYLSLREYQSMGDLQAGLTPLENAVRQAADGVFADLKPEPDAEAALKEAFVPAMVRVNDQGEYVRSAARWDELPAKAYPLLQGLVDARLLVVQGDPRKVEVAHEALLRKWPRLRAWLDEAREFLIGKQQVESDLRDWESAAAADKAAALLTGLKLSRMRAWMAERPHQLSAQMRAFGQASIEQAEAEQVRKQRQRRNLTRASLAAAAILACFAAFALYQWSSARRALAQAREALNQLAVEMVRYSWIDMGHKQEENALLTNLAKQSGKDLYDVLPKAAGSPYSLASGDFDCHTSLTQGFRYLYCSLHDVIGLQKLQSITRQSVFLPGGPHENELILDDKQRFGHYNPAFLDWVESHILPEATDDPRPKALIKLAYDAQIGPAARALYHTHQILFASPDAIRAFPSDWAAARQRFQATGSNEGYFENRPKPLEEIRNEYQKNIRPGGSTDTQESFRWLSDYDAFVNRDDWYLSNTAGGFWMRRSLDGTEPQIFRIVTKLLQAYDPEVLR